ncbi:hypothetical protein A3L09_00535 [Thermococcus profundus]|uniref:DUF1850 domain-containing protein n=1 Tax=Thermococcus profundus TaxID=49899 RepID=A0A2Z2MHD1_THEPR|nr:DUF1850 domain-containing protein [Thermococcus profundus]ASJ01851.1 hypothetical protein A3L09_00535 [Thermococcus profundus]
MRKFLFFFLFAVAGLGFLFPSYCLSISDGSSERVYPLGDLNVTIDYIHSVERSEVIEVLEVNSSGIYARQMWWKDFGAGLPEDFQTIRNGFYFKEINIPLGKSLDFWFIPLNRARIYVNGRLALKPAGDTLVSFRVERCFLIQKIVGRC